MVGIMVAPRVAPPESLDMAVRIDVIGLPLMSVVTNPALAAEVARAPLHQRRLSDPRVVIVLSDVSVFAVFRRIERLGVTLSEHNDVRVWQRTDGRIGRKAGK